MARAESTIDLSDAEKRDLVALREGKSQVVCDGGQLYKVSKSKDKVVSRDKLTRAWTDWVDYWAVDFDYGSRKEIVKRPRSLALQGSLIAPSQRELVEWEDWGPAATSSKTNGRASARGRTARWS